MYYLASLPAWLLCLIFLLSGVGISITGLILVRKYGPPVVISNEQLRPLASICTIIGSLSAILIAFVVVNTWQRYNDQDKNLVQEATELGNLYRATNGLEKAPQQQIKSLIRKYTHSLIEDAWPALVYGQESNRAWVNYNNLHHAIIHLSPKDDTDRIIFSRMLDNVNDLANNRRIRILHSRIPIIPDVLWYLLLISALVSVAFTFFFKIGSLSTQIAITSIHASVISLLFFLMVLLNYPYRSAIRIKPYPLEILLKEVFPKAD